MTALNFVIEEDSIYLAMDTLALNSENHKPQLHTSKIYPLPHLCGVMCGTGALPLVVNWLASIQTECVARDIVELGTCAPPVLRELWKKLGCPASSTTIYHFGYSHAERKCRGFAFRSEHDFGLEELVYGSGIKPPIPIGVDGFRDLPRQFIETMVRQKEEDDQLPLGKRIGIGGEIHFAMVTEKTIILNVCHRFDDYESQYEQMCLNLPQA